MKYLLSLVLVFTIHSNTKIYRISLGKNPDCNGFNFCSISANTSLPRKENEVLSYINLIDDTHIEFSFIKNTVSDKAFLKYFATGYFLLDEDFALPEEICREI